MAAVKSSPSQMGRGTIRKMVEGQDPNRWIGPSTIADAMVPLPTLRVGRIF